MNLLGAAVTIHPDHAAAPIPEAKRIDSIRDVEGILTTECLTPGHAAKLQGRWGFSQSILVGKYGRGQLQPTTNRQYSRAVKGRPLNPELREVLPCWVGVLKNPTGRRTWFHGQKPIVVYTDAAGCGHMGAVIFDGEETLVFPTHVPEWMNGRDIYDIEMRASFYGLRLAAGFYPERPLIFCGCNRGTVQTLVRGAFRATVASHMCATFWNVAAFPISV